MLSAQSAESLSGNQPEPHEFMRLISHELRNPLSVIRGYADLMRTRGAYNEVAVNAILTQARRLERLLNDLIDTAQAEAGRLRLRRRSTNLTSLIQAAAAEARALTGRHRIRVEVPEEPLIGRWDRDRLSQVLHNLLGNVIKYAPDGTEVLILLKRSHATGAVRVSVIDEGPGVADEALPHLFERFYRASVVEGSETPGLGLGLYISRMLVEAHGGRIWVERMGRGTAFHFTLPHGSARRRGRP